MDICKAYSPVKMIMRRLLFIGVSIFLAQTVPAQELIGIFGKTIPDISYDSGTIPQSGGPGLLHGNRYYLNDFNIIKIFDLNFRLLRKFDLPANVDLFSIAAIAINDYNGDIILISEKGNSLVYSPEGILKKTMRFRATGSTNAYDGRLMIIDNKMLFFDDNGKLQSLDYLNTDSAVPVKKDDILYYLDRYPGFLLEYPELNQRVADFLVTNGVILENSRLFFLSSDQCLKYLGILREYFKTEDKVNAAFLDIRHFLGHDAHGNLYLQVRIEPRQFDKILVISKYGDYLEFLDLDIGGTYMDGVSLKGDIYFMTAWPIGSSQLNTEGSYEYRFVNRWDPISDQEVAAYENSFQSGLATAKLEMISASSIRTEPTDKNAYQPIKLFDGDPKTMWIENATGPGIGESVTVGFEKAITIDEIQFMPGCFWADYWKQNYRVKRLEVKLDGKAFTVDFKDEMVVQSLKLNAPMSFKTAGFTIKDVYPTIKWEDTAISEIAFYYQGKKI
jgi:hypothetical protein